MCGCPAAFPAISADPDGEFVVVWQVVGPGGLGLLPDIEGRRYAPDGTALGESFVVNGSADSADSRPDVAKGPDAEFVVVWSGGYYSDEPEALDIRGRRYDPNGVAAADVFQVNTENRSEDDPAVAIGPSGEFLVVWGTSRVTEADDSGSSIRSRLYSSDGQPAGGERAVNTSTFGRQWRPAVAAGPDGRFLAVWESETSVADLVRTYSNPLGTAAAAITDIQAFATCPPSQEVTRLLEGPYSVDVPRRRLWCCPRLLENPCQRAWRVRGGSRYIRRH